MEGGTLTVETALGAVSVVYTECGVRAVHLGGSVPSTGKPPAFVRSLAADLQRYAAGARVGFHAPLDLEVGTAFQRRVWDLLRQIPYGQARSYFWLAQQLGQPGATRAAGSACGANPAPILIPCHRVLRINGELGGFSAGLDWKRRLLALEGVAVR